MLCNLGVLVSRSDGIKLWSEIIFPFGRLRELADGIGTPARRTAKLRTPGQNLIKFLCVFQRLLKFLKKGLLQTELANMTAKYCRYWGTPGQICSKFVKFFVEQ